MWNCETGGSYRELNQGPVLGDIRFIQEKQGVPNKQRLSAAMLFHTPGPKYPDGTSLS